MSVAVYGRDSDVEVLVRLYRRESVLNTRKNIALHLLMEKGVRFSSMSCLPHRHSTGFLPGEYPSQHRTSLCKH